MTISENLLRIKQAKEEIREAIISKGVEVLEDDKIDVYASKVNLIVTGETRKMQGLIVMSTGVFRDTEKPYSSVTVSNEYFYTKYTDADGNKYIVNERGEKIITLSPIRSKITYTSTDGLIVEPISTAFDATIISNTYEGGKGTIVFDGNLTVVGGFGSKNTLKTIELPDTVKTISTSTFEDCSELTDITLYNNVEEIKNYAFYDCYKLSNITIPNSVKSIGNYAFGFCNSLTSVTIPDSVTSINYGTFQNCSSLSSVTIPDSVTSIGNYAFLNCVSLTSVTMPNSVTNIGSNIFDNVSPEGVLTCYKEWFDKLSSVEISNLGNVYSWVKVYIDQPLNEITFNNVGFTYEGGVTYDLVSNEGVEFASINGSWSNYTGSTIYPDYVISPYSGKKIFFYQEATELERPNKYLKGLRSSGKYFEITFKKAGEYTLFVCNEAGMFDEYTTTIKATVGSTYRLDYDGRNKKLLVYIIGNLSE